MTNHFSAYGTRLKFGGGGKERSHCCELAADVICPRQPPMHGMVISYNAYSNLQSRTTYKQASAVSVGNENAAAYFDCSSYNC